jgi:hypothetical protein
MWMVSRIEQSGLESPFSLKKLCTEDSLVAGSPFAARLAFSSKLPVLALEDIELHLDSIQCSEAAIKISLESRYHFHKAREAWGNIGDFLVVTSHPGCNHNGERSPYLYVFPPANL